MKDRYNKVVTVYGIQVDIIPPVLYPRFNREIDQLVQIVSYPTDIRVHFIGYCPSPTPVNEIKLKVT